MSLQGVHAKNPVNYYYSLKWLWVVLMCESLKGGKSTKEEKEVQFITKDKLSSK